MHLQLGDKGIKRLVAVEDTQAEFPARDPNCFPLNVLDHSSAIALSEGFLQGVLCYAVDNYRELLSEIGTQRFNATEVSPT